MPERPLRADARRNRERIMTAAGELFARLGREAQMEQIAERCGLGMGTLYRHFPNKQALLTAMVRERFQGMAELANAAEQLSDPRESFETIVRDYLEAAEGDASFQFALMDARNVDWGDVAKEKTQFVETVSRIIDRAVTAGQIREDLTFSDFTLLTHGAMSIMYFKPAGNSDWRRHLDLALTGIRTSAGNPND
jgi:AcrR family transcriptional regulator